jgi:hypothetical protein
MVPSRRCTTLGISRERMVSGGIRAACSGMKWCMDAKPAMAQKVFGFGPVA